MSLEVLIQAFQENNINNFLISLNNLNEDEMKNLPLLKISDDSGCSCSLLEYYLEVGQVDVVKALLKIDAVKVYASAKDNEALRHAVLHGHLDIFNALLEIDDVKANAAAKDNQALCFAAYNGQIDMVKALLEIDMVKANAATEANYALRTAAKEGYADIVKALLKIDMVRCNAATNDNEALHNAVAKGYVEIVKVLLEINDVKANVAAYNNKMLRFSVKKGYIGIVEALLAVPTVVDLLFRQEGNNLIEILGRVSFNSPIWLMFKNITIYGVPFSQLMKGETKERCLIDIQFFCNSPESYLEKKTDYSLGQRQAVRILKSYQEVTAYEQMQEEERLMMEQERNPDDEKKIAGVLKHFDKTIKPYFVVKFNSRGATPEERIERVESDIRALLLSRMKSEAENQLKAAEIKEEEKVMLNARIAFIEAHAATLKLGKDKALMDDAREHFSSNTDNNQVAWRAYDRWAPCAKEWPNLLTHPLEEMKQHIFTLDVLGESDLGKASLMVRELIAVSFYLVMDEQESDIATKQDRIENFIGQLKDIRRAHNRYDNGMDNPSCFPGTVSRVGIMWSMHSLALSKKIVELLPEILRAKVANTLSVFFDKCNSQEREELYSALVMLRKENAQDVIAKNKETEFANKQEWAQKRQEFIESLGSHVALQEYVNQTLEETGMEDKLIPEQRVYLLQYLADIGGGWSAEALTAIYLKFDKKIEIEEIPAQLKISNPFLMNENMRKILGPARAQKREQQFAAWNQVFPILEKQLNVPQEVLEQVFKFISIDWAACAAMKLDLKFSDDTQEELEKAGFEVKDKQGLFELVFQQYKKVNKNLFDEIASDYNNNNSVNQSDCEDENYLKRSKFR